MFVFYNIKDWTIQLPESFTAINLYAYDLLLLCVCLGYLFTMSQSLGLMGGKVICNWDIANDIEPDFL